MTNKHANLPSCVAAVLCLMMLFFSVSLLADDDPSAQKEKKEKDSGGVSFKLKKPPSLRFGKWLRIDFRAKFQGDFRGFSPFQTTDDGLFNLHRKRVAIEGNFLKHFEYEVEGELKKAPDRWKDVYLNFRYFRDFQIRVGRFKLPFGMEQNTGTMNLDFIYRTSVSDNVTPGRDRGIAAHGRFFNRGLNYEAGIFVRDGDNSLSKRSAGAERTFAGRLTGTPLRLLPVPALFKDMHFGMAFTSGTVPEGLKGLRGRTYVSKSTYFPEVYVHGQRLRLGWEWSWMPGPFSLKSEFIHMQDERLGQSIRAADLPNLISRGWYVSGTWLITKEKKAEGVEPRRPFLQKGGIGAVELAARYDVLRFGSSEHPGTPSRSPRAANILGNSDRAWTFGLNWYLNRWIKIQVNSIREKIEDTERSPIFGQDSYWVRLCRLQFVM